MNRVLAGILILACFCGCSPNSALKRQALTEESPWAFARGDLAGLGSVTIPGFSGQLNLIWESRVSDKPIGPMTIYHDQIIYSGTKKRIRFIDLATGRQVGQYKTKGLAQSGVVLRDSIAYYSLAPKKNRLMAVNLVHRDQLWSHPIKDAASGSIIVDNRLIVGSGDGRLSAYDLKSGKLAWSFQTGGKLVAPPTFGSGLIFQPDAQGRLYAVSLSDGKEQFTVHADGPLVSLAVIADRIYFADVDGGLYAADPSDGRLIWHAKANSPVWGPPAVADGRVIVGTSRGEVKAFDAETGLPLWTVDCQEVVKAPPLAINGYVLAGTLGGHLFLINAGDGSVVDRTTVAGAIAVSPVTDGRRIYVATQKGRILCFGESNAKDPSSIQRKHAEN